jgi:hypothetical protein
MSTGVTNGSRRLWLTAGPVIAVVLLLLLVVFAGLFHNHLTDQDGNSCPLCHACAQAAITPFASALIAPLLVREYARALQTGYWPRLPGKASLAPRAPPRASNSAFVA